MTIALTYKPIPPRHNAMKTPPFTPSALRAEAPFGVCAGGLGEELALEDVVEEVDRQFAVVHAVVELIEEEDGPTLAVEVLGPFVLDVLGPFVLEVLGPFVLDVLGPFVLELLGISLELRGTV